VALTSSPTNLDPRFALDAGSQRIDQLLYDALVAIDDNLKIVPHLAESWENPNDTTFRFRIRKGVKFHNGLPVFALEVKSTFDRILDPKFGSPYIASFKNIKEVKVLEDPYVLEIQLHKPQAGFLTDLTLIKAMPLSEEYTKDKFIGSGPYQFVKRTSQEIILKKNPDHFKYRPKTDKIVFKIIKDDNTRLLKLQNGEIDLIQNALNADAVVKIQKDPKLTTTKSPGLTYSYLGFNLKDNVLKNRNVRRAIAHAINREQIVKHLLQNLATPAKSVLSPLNWYYEDNVEEFAYDIEKAKRLLKSSVNQLPLKLQFKTSTNTESVNIARLIASDLKKIGIEVDIRTHEWGTFFKDIKTGNFQLFSLRWVGVTDPDIYYELFHSSNVPPGRNRVHYINPKLDSLLEQGKTTIDLKKRKAIFSKVQKIVARDLPYVSLWHTSNVAVYSSRLKGFYFHPQASFMPFVSLYKD